MLNCQTCCEWIGSSPKCIILCVQKCTGRGDGLVKANKPVTKGVIKPFLLSLLPKKILKCLLNIVIIVYSHCDHDLSQGDHGIHNFFTAVDILKLLLVCLLLLCP